MGRLSDTGYESCHTDKDLGDIPLKTMHTLAREAQENAEWDGDKTPECKTSIPTEPGIVDRFKEDALRSRGHATDKVRSPDHYTQGYIETIYAIAQTLGPEGFKAFCMGNWIKYNDRHMKKGGREDLDKADQYLYWAVNGLPKPINYRVPR